MNNPLVSIVVPCFNQGKFLNDALQSILDQTYLNWECIIVNDGSLDKTEEIAHSWIQKDNRFLYLFQENKGVSSARNSGIEKTTGKIILALDADDKIGTEYIQRAVKEFENDSTLSLVYANARLFGEKEGHWNLAPFNFKDFLLHNCIYSSALFKREDFIAVNGYDVQMDQGLEDWEFYIHLLSLYDIPKVKKLDYEGFFYRIRSNSRNTMIFQNQNFKSEMITHICNKHYLLYDQYFGNFIDVFNRIKENDSVIKYHLKSEKFVIDLFCNTFFGFTLFNKKNKLIQNIFEYR